MTFVARPGKRPKKKGACLPVCVRRTGRRGAHRACCVRAARTGRRGLLFRELPLWWKRKLLPCGPLGRFWTMVMDGTARKSPFNPAAFAWAPLVVVHAVAFVGATLVVAHQATAERWGGVRRAGGGKSNVATAAATPICQRNCFHPQWVPQREHDNCCLTFPSSEVIFLVRYAKFRVFGREGRSHITLREDQQRDREEWELTRIVNVE